MEEVHGIYDQCAVRGVLPGGIRELLNRVDRGFVEAVLPGAEVRRGPVAVYPLHVRGPVLGDLVQQGLDQPSAGILGVNEDGEMSGPGSRKGRHGSSPGVEQWRE